MKKTPSGQGLKILGLFCIAVFFLVVISLIFKGYTVLVKSLFDGTHRFTFAQNGNPIRISSFAPDSKTISLLKVTHSAKPNEKSIENIVKIPIDATITDTAVSSPEQGSVDEYLKYLFFHYNAIDTKMTPLDLLRLWFFARSVHQTEILSETVTIFDKDTQANVVDKIAEDLFTDDAIVKENQSIQIVNATGVPGIGTDFARILSNMGGNVVSVSTATKINKKTTVSYYMQSSYTVEKLEKLLNTKAVIMKKKGISDIIITLGKDRVK